jgi:hypothetical protein
MELECIARSIRTGLKPTAKQLKTIYDALKRTCYHMKDEFYDEDDNRRTRKTKEDMIERENRFLFNRMFPIQLHKPKLSY